MSGYSVTEKRVKTERKPKGTTCGDCGEPVTNGRLLCDDCISEIALAGPILSEARRER